MKKSVLLGTVCAALFTLGLAVTSDANLLGDTINCAADSSSAITCNPSPTVVGDGIESAISYLGEDRFFIDVSDSSITITASPIANPGIGWGFELSGLDWNGSGELIGFENFFSNVGPLTPSDPRFPTGVIESDILIGPHSIHIDLSTSDWEAGDYVSFDLIGASSSALLTEEKILASDGVRNDYFGGTSGSGISISGDYAIVGAHGVDDPSNYNPDLVNRPGVDFFGAAYIYHYDGTSWVEQQKLIASDGTASNNFGYSVAISGNNAIVGAYYGDGNVTDSGAAYIYHYDGTSWVEQQKLTASDGDVYDHFGQYVSISGNYAIVGAYAAGIYPANTGAAYIYHYDGTSWVEQQKLTPSDGSGGDWFGHAVSISGDHAVIGAQLNDDNGYTAGSAYIFHYDGTSWVEQQELLASDGLTEDRFGSAVSISGGYAIVGASHGDGLVADSGTAYVFHYDGTNWVEQQKLRAYDGGLNDRFGNSVSISGDNAVVNGNVNTGAAYIYHYDGNSWVEAEKLVSSDIAPADWFGDSVSISGSKVIVGAPADDDNGGMSGSAYIYTGFSIDQVYVDKDNDGYVLADDCNDNDASFNPSAIEVCGDGLDNDCDGLADPSDPDCPVDVDADNDGYASAADCNDNAAAINPGALEVCGDGLDNDCDGLDDICADVDSDGYDVTVDCNDNDASVNPGAMEVCDDYLDNDCDEMPDTFDPDCFDFDGDGDGYDFTVDCNDYDAAINPGALEVCGDGLDNDCDGLIDSFDPDCPADVDGDGYDVALDCNDNEAAIAPDAQEVCGDGIDNNCDGLVDSEDLICAPTCVPTFKKEKGKRCYDGVDNDCDGLIDGVDPDCGGEGKGKTCSDGLDNDVDGFIDCADSDCSASRVCG